MGNLKTIEGKVRAILQKDEEARNDDMLLYLKVCNGCLKDTGAMPFAEVALRASAGHAVNYRRNIQSLWETPV